MAEDAEHDASTVADGDAGATADGALWAAQGIPAPARRALLAADILTLADLRSTDLDTLGRLHGMGPKALERLRLLRDG